MAVKIAKTADRKKEMDTTKSTDCPKCGKPTRIVKRVKDRERGIPAGFLFRARRVNLRETLALSAANRLFLGRSHECGHLLKIDEARGVIGRCARRCAGPAESSKLGRATDAPGRAEVIESRVEAPIRASHRRRILPATWPLGTVTAATKYTRGQQDMPLPRWTQATALRAELAVQSPLPGVKPTAVFGHNRVSGEQSGRD